MQREADKFSGPAALVAEGYLTLAQALARGLDVRLQHAVSRVEYTPPTADGQRGSVRVYSSAGCVEGSCAVLAVPLACLQAGHIAFSPPLPPQKQRALRAVGVGTVNKVRTGWG